MRQFLATMVLCSVAVAASPVHAREWDARRRASLTLHVVDGAGVPARDLRVAREAVQRDFHNIGVDVEWSAGAPVPGADASTRHVTVVVLSDAMARQKIPDVRVRERTMGTAVVAASRAYILYGNVLRAAEQAGVQTGVPLAHAILHEVGHVLLRRGHADAGVMRRQLPPLGITTFAHFTADEGATIRSVLRAPLLTEPVFELADGHSR